MDFEFFLAVNLTMLSGLAILLGLVRRRRVERSWVIAHGIVVIAGAMALWLEWPHAGTLVTLLFVPLIALPGAFASAAVRRSYAGDTKAAARFARLASVFHPSAAQRLNARLVAAEAEDDSDATAAALDRLIKVCAPEERPVLETIRARKADRWDQVLETCDKNPAVEALGAMDLRALGELGRIDEMVMRYAAKKSNLGGADVRDAELFVLAFSGRRAAVDVLFNDRKLPYDAATKAYWRAIAALRSTEGCEEGRRLLEAAALESDRSSTHRAVARHLAAAPIDAATALSPVAREELDRIEARLSRDAPLKDAGFWSTPLTTVLMLANAVMFGFEISGGGTEDLETLVGLGALWPPLVLEHGEWWRLVTSTFLHFGWVHLAANMFMLSLLGRLVEVAFGWVRMLLIYIVGGIVSAAAALALMQSAMTQFAVLVGASGSVMAVFGALTARQISNWQASRDVLDRQRVATFALVLGVQFLIDLSIPQVSFAAHLAGFATGLALGFGLMTRRFK